MASGRVKLSMSCSSLCPVVELAQNADCRNEILSRCGSGRSRVVEEFASPASDLDESCETVEIEKTFENATTSIYRFEREDAEECPRERIEELGCPVTDEFVEDGRLHFTFHASDHETVREVVSHLQSEVGDVRLDRFVGSADESQSDPAVVDRERLTDRQRQTLETALEMGYFDHPKRANASEIAAELDIAPSTFTEHLAAAQAKLFEDLFGT